MRLDIQDIRAWSVAQCHDAPKHYPGFRVVRSDRSLAFEYGSDSYREQSQLLKQEGITFEGKKSDLLRVR